MPEIHDPLASTLDTLRSDVERTPLADSMTVRRRGDQRTRRQAVGGALAVVALVLGAVGVAGGLSTDSSTRNIPATKAPTEKPLSLTAAPLLTPGDLGNIGIYDNWQVNPDPAAADQQLSMCVPVPSALGGTETRRRMLYSDVDASITEHVVRFADAEAARTAMTTLTGAFATCSPGDPAEAKVVDRAPEDVAVGTAVDTAMHASRTSTPVQASEPTYYELGVARRSNVLVVLQWQSSSLPKGMPWVWDAKRFATAVGNAVG